MSDRYEILRLVRRGPLMPVRLFWCDHEPSDPTNKLDRWPIPFRAVEIAGRWFDARHEDDIVELWTRANVAPTHWRYPQVIPEWVYRHRTAQIEWCREWRPTDPRLHPWRAVDVAAL